MNANPAMSREDALLAARAFIVPEDMGTPPGALSLRGATNFQTPSGWDTVYTPIFNMIDRPVAPMLVVRVETDWYAHETEFRYVLEPGEGISGSHIDADRAGAVRAARRDHLPRLHAGGARGDQGVGRRSSRATRRPLA